MAHSVKTLLVVVVLVVGPGYTGSSNNVERMQRDTSAYTT